MQVALARFGRIGLSVALVAGGLLLNPAAATAADAVFTLDPALPVLEGFAPETPPLLAWAELRGGWSSSATDRAGGPSDFFIRHEKRVDFNAAVAGYGLRGTAGFTERRWLTHVSEDDTEFDFRTSFSRALGGSDEVNGEIGLEFESKGFSEIINGVLVPVRADTLVGEFSADWSRDFGTYTLTLGAGYLSVLKGATLINGKTPNLEQRQPNETLYSGFGALSWKTDDGAAWSIRGDAFLPSIAEADQAQFNRMPVNGLRASYGYANNLASTIWFDGRAGLELLWSKRSGDTRLAPYATVYADMQITDRLQLALDASTYADLIEPDDGQASQVASAELSLRYDMSEQLRLKVGPFLYGTRGIYDRNNWYLESGIRAGADYAINAYLAASIAAELSRRADQAGAYDTAEATFGMRAKL